MDREIIRLVDPKCFSSLIYEIHNKELSKTHGISIGDFPDVTKMQEQLREADFSKFKAIHKSTLEKVRFFPDMTSFDPI